MRSFIQFKKQAGTSLLELMAYLIIALFVISGAVALWNQVTSSSSGLALIKDVVALRSGAQGIFVGQGNYGNGSLNASLILFKKVPSDISQTGGTLTASNGGVFTVTGNGSNIIVSLTGQTADSCGALLTQSIGWASVQVGTNAAITTFPVTPDVAGNTANCGGTEPFTITWTSFN